MIRKEKRKTPPTAHTRFPVVHLDIIIKLRNIKFINGKKLNWIFDRT